MESPDIPIIGVGEGTWPSMRMTLQKIGLAEADLVRQCEASFKQGTRFTGWSRQGDDCQYVHPFSLPAEYATLNLAEHWLATEAAGPFCRVRDAAGGSHRGRARAQAVGDSRIRVQRQLRLSLRRRQVCPDAASTCGRPLGCPVRLRKRRAGRVPGRRQHRCRWCWPPVSGWQATCSSIARASGPCSSAGSPGPNSCRSSRSCSTTRRSRCRSRMRMQASPSPR